MNNKMNKLTIIIATILILFPFGNLVKLHSPLLTVLLPKVIGFILFFKQYKYFTYKQSLFFKTICGFYIAYIALNIFITLFSFIANTESYSSFSGFIMFILLDIFLSYSANILLLIFCIMLIFHKDTLKRDSLNVTNSNENKKIYIKRKLEYIYGNYLTISDKLSKTIIIIAAIFIILSFSLIMRYPISNNILFFLINIIGFILFATQYQYFTQKEKLLFKIITCSNFIFIISRLIISILSDNSIILGSLSFLFIEMLNVLSFLGNWVFYIILTIMLLLSNKKKIDT